MRLLAAHLHFQAGLVGIQSIAVGHGLFQLEFECLELTGLLFEVGFQFLQLGGACAELFLEILHELGVHGDLGFGRPEAGAALFQLGLEFSVGGLECLHFHHQIDQFRCGQWCFGCLGGCEYTTGYLGYEGLVLLGALIEGDRQLGADFRQQADVVAQGGNLRHGFILGQVARPG